MKGIGLMGVAGDPAQRPDAVQNEVVKIVSIAKTNELGRAEAHDVAELGSPRILLTGDEQITVLKVRTGFAERVLRVVRGPEVPHPQHIADTHVLGGDPVDEERILPRRAPNVNMIVGGIPSHRGRIDPSLEPILPLDRTAVNVYRISNFDIFIPFRYRNDVGPVLQFGVESPLDVERAVGLEAEAVGVIPHTVHHANGLFG